MAKVRDLKKEFLQNNPNHQIEITGNIALNNAFIELTFNNSILSIKINLGLLFKEDLFNCDIKSLI